MRFQSSPVKWLFGIVLLVMPSLSLAASNGPLVRGFIAASVGGKNELGDKSPPREDVYLPGVRVFLRDPQTKTDSHAVTTDLSGRFTIRVAKPARYLVCWEAKAIPSACSQDFISVNRPHESVGTIRLALPRERGSVAVYGRVSHADGSSPRSFEPLANVNALAKVTLLDERGGEVYEVAVNNHDQYLLPLVPIGKRMQLRVHQEKYERGQLLQLGNARVPTQKIDLVILNTPPNLEPLVVCND